MENKSNLNIIKSIETFSSLKPIFIGMKNEFSSETNLGYCYIVIEYFEGKSIINFNLVYSNLISMCLIY